MKIQFIFFIFSFTSFSLCAQKTERIKEKGNQNSWKVTYHVLKENKNVFHGSYIYEFQKNTLIKGQYDRGKRAGKWKFHPEGNGLRYEGSYSAGVQNGIWIYSTSNDTICEIFYSRGKVDSVFSYRNDGSVATRLQVDDDGVGFFTTHYRNGQIAESIPISDFAINGMVEVYHSNGNPFLKIEYFDDVPKEIVLAKTSEGENFDAGNLKDGEGEISIYRLHDEKAPTLHKIVNYKNYLKEGDYKEYDTEGNLIWSGNMKDGARLGEWLRFGSEGVDTIYYNTPMEVQEYIPLDNDFERLDYSLFYLNDQLSFPAKFIGGMAQFKEFVSREIIYPDELKYAGAKGYTVATFEISETGEVESSQIVVSSLKPYDDEVLRVVERLPLWYPAMFNGVPSKQVFRLPVNMSSKRGYRR